MSIFTHHIFVCRKCDGSDNADLRSALKSEIKRLGLKGTVRANESGCLDQCKQGQVIVIYPQAIWYGNVKIKDVPRIVSETILRGVVLEDLLIAPVPCSNRGSEPRVEAAHCEDER